MTDQEDSGRHQRLSEYLSELQPTTQVEVMREVELSELRGNSLGASFKTVMNELRRGIRKSGLPVTSLTSPSVVFYMPIEPFVIDAASDEAVPATVPRACLNPIWAWICRDLLPKESKDYIQTARKALDSDDQASAVAAAVAFQDQVARTGPAAVDTKAATLGRRLSAYGAPQTIVADLRCVLGLLQRRDALAAIAKNLPAELDLVDGSSIERVATLLGSPEEGDMVPYALALIMSRLNDPWQIVHLAARDGKTREAVADLVLGRARATAAAMQTDQWSIHEAADARARVDALKSGIDMIRSQLRPHRGSVEERRWNNVAGLVERCERKIDLTMRTMTNAAGPRPVVQQSGTVQGRQRRA